MALFKDRIDAGKRLAAGLAKYAGRKDVIVLALPRGGVPVGFEVAKALHAPLDVFLVRKLGVPGHEELAIGAIAAGGVRVINEDVVQHYHVSEQDIEEVARRERRELERRLLEYRGDRPFPDMRGRCAVVVDDGLATGATMRAAIQALRLLSPARIVAASPVSAPDVCALVETEVDEMLCLETPEPFGAVGNWYGVFAQTSDEEVRKYLARAERTRPSGHQP